MKYNFNNQLIIHYEKNRFTDTYKRVINKTDNNKYNVITYFKSGDRNMAHKSMVYFTEELIEELINIYINEFGIKKRIEYK